MAQKLLERAQRLKEKERKPPADDTEMMEIHQWFKAVSAPNEEYRDVLSKSADISGKLGAHY
jgi:hypothetical protein